MSDNILIREAYQKVQEIDSSMRNWNMTKANAPLQGMVIVRSGDSPRGFEAWFQDGKIFKAKSMIPGAMVETKEADALFQRGYPLGKALSATVYFDPNFDIENELDTIRGNSPTPGGTPETAQPGIGSTGSGAITPSSVA